MAEFLCRPRHCAIGEQRQDGRDAAAAALPDANSGGFHVLILDRSTLQPISHALYLVNHSGTRDSTQVKAMGTDLYAVTSPNGHWNDGCNCSPITHLCPD